MVGLLIAAAVATPLPLFSGEVIPQDRAPFPSAQVEFPAGWSRMADHVNASPRSGKVLILPLAPFYQMTTDWGFHGADLTARQLIERPVIQVLPGGYFGETDGFSSLVHSVEARLTVGDTAGVPRLLEGLGVSHLIVRHDFLRGVSDGEYAEHEPIESSLRDVAGISRAGSYEVANLYEFDRVDGNVRLASHAATIPPQDVASSVASLGRSTIGAIDLYETEGAFAWKTGRTGSVAVTSFDTATHLDITNEPALLMAYVDDGGLVISESVAMTIDGDQLATPRQVRHEGEIVGLRSGSNLVALDTVPRLIPTDSEALEIGSADPATTGRFSALEDCARIDDRSPAQTGLSSNQHTDRSVTLTSIAHSACVWSRINNIDPLASYRITVRAEQITGSSPRACVWLEGPDECVTLSPDTDSSPADDTQLLSALVQPTPATTGMRIFVYADGADTGQPTTITYHQPNADIITWEPTSLVDQLLEPELTEKQLPAGEYRFSVEPLVGGPSVGRFSALEDCARIDDRSPAQTGLSSNQHTDRSVTLTSIAHSACVWSRINNIDPLASYRITVRAEQITGSSPRACVWLEGPDECVTLSPDTDSSPADDTQLLSALVQPTPATTGMRIFVYADGADTGQPTTITYHQPNADIILPASVEIGPHGAELDDAIVDVSASRTSPASYRVDLPMRTDVGVLVLSESYADGWVISLPAADHFVADGYANGWVIDPGPATSVDLTYRPAIRVRMLGLIPLLLLDLSLIVWVALPFIPAKPGRHRRK